MNARNFLYAAYIATWAIHGGYLVSLVVRYKRLRQRMKELAKTNR
jgi:CcmD family protein